MFLLRIQQAAKAQKNNQLINSLSCSVPTIKAGYKCGP